MVIHWLKDTATSALRPGIVDEVQSIRLERENELTEMLGDDLTPTSPGISRSNTNMSNLEILEVYEGVVISPLWLRLWGVLPWGHSGSRENDTDSKQGSRASFYQTSVLIVAALVAAAAIEQLVDAQMASIQADDGMSLCGRETCIQFRHISSMFFATGSLFGLLAVRAFNIIGTRDSLLVLYARRQGVIEAWACASRRQCTLVMVLWVSSVAAQALASWPDSIRSTISLVVFAFASGVFTALAYCVLHVCCALAMMIDTFCFHFVEEPDLDESVREWNILQAVLRKGSSSLERMFLVLQTTALLGVLFGFSDAALGRPQNTGRVAAFMLSVSLLGVGIARLFFTAAQVTEKCSRVPPLINSLSFGLDVDPARHYIVEYVTYSGAGFYIDGVRITRAMALKIIYVSCILIFSVAVKVVSGDNSQ